jgi:exopolyphosphatase/pppGpp-phosphohydrolase
MRVADRGVREGILLALIDEVNGESPASRVQ